MKYICGKCNTEWEEDVTVPPDKAKLGARKIITCTYCGEKYVHIPDGEECSCADCESKCSEPIH